MKSTLKNVIMAAVVVFYSHAAQAQTLPTPAPVTLSTTDTGKIIAQAVFEAQGQSRPATIAVVDRMGNVLGVFAMNGAPATVAIPDLRSPGGGLEGASVPATTAAIAKAITGAYLSSSGNAFSTRVASQIVQEHFNVGERFAPGGPLFGVQFSSLPCSDLNTRFASDNGGLIAAGIGPKRSPLGLSADPGGFPLYKNGVVVGGVGVAADSVYGLDEVIRDIDVNFDEIIALASTVGFDAPLGIQASRIAVDGRTLRYSDATTRYFRRNPALAPAFNTINGSAGNLVAVNGYAAASLTAGVAYGTPASGIRPDGGTNFTNPNAFVLVDSVNTPRYAPIAGTDTNGLTQTETRRILSEALGVAVAARAQIRQPLNSRAQVTISVVDSNGVVLGVVRTPDAPIFGIDVSLQKARTAMQFSHPGAGADLTTAGAGNYVTMSQTFFGKDVLNGSTAFTARAIGNLARPFYPDGIDGKPNGPFSLPFNNWSPFNDGLQLDLVAGNIVQHLGYAQTGAGDTPARCTALPLAGMSGSNRIANGIQIFPGGSPIYRGNILVGGIGVSGDGVDQDDMIGFLGLQRAGAALGGFGHAPALMRSDRLIPRGTRLRYVSCPFAPFVGQRNGNPCNG